MSAADIENVPEWLSAALRAGEEMGQVENRIVMMPDGDDENADRARQVPVSLVSDGDGGSRVGVDRDLMKAIDERRAAPRDRDGMHTVHELDSFIAFVDRYKSEHTLAWADQSSFRVVVVFDDHPQGAEHDRALWRKHRALYTCPRSPEWLAWCAIDGKAQKQDEFADFLESRLEDMRSIEGFPMPMDVLTMARNLAVRTKGTFERALDPTTGNATLLNKTESDTGSTVIPRAFVIGVPVFEGGDPYQVECRVRLQVTDGRAAFTIVMHRRKEIERAAFLEVRNEIANLCSVPVLAGAP